MTSLKKEQLKNEPTRQEKQFLKDQREVIAEFERVEKRKEALKRREQVKELFCMVKNKKAALGPNPLSRKSKKIKKADKPRRKRKGKRSKALS